MNTGIISMRYARALFDYALENKTEETLFDEMKSVVSAFSAHPELRGALDNPVLDRDDKLKLIQAASGGNPGEVYNRFVCLLLDHRRENHLQTIALVYLDLYRKHKNISVGKLVTATTVDNQVVDKMKKLMESKLDGTLEFETKTDPDIEGGFVLYFDTYRLDASVKTQLQQIKSELASGKVKIG